MTENPAEEEAIPTPPDTWRKLAEDALRYLLSEYLWGIPVEGETAFYGALSERLAARMAVDEHPPVFHVRRSAKRIVGRRAIEQWRWVAIHPNGNKLYGSTESYENKSHAVEQARSVADGIGAEVRVEGEGE